MSNVGGTLAQRAAGEPRPSLTSNPRPTFAWKSATPSAPNGKRK
ncbi:MAG: hypothetical protein WAZ19_07725 [Anaerolineae bacterium]